MKSFFKTFLASFLGSALLLVVLFIVMITSIISSIVSSSDTAISVKPQSILYMTLDHEISERSNANDLGLVFTGNGFKMSDNAGMNDIINNIKAAAIDPNISGIFLELSTIGTSSANIEEIRNALNEFKKSGKFIVSYSETYSQSAYYLASISDEIYMFPDGVLDVHGMATQNIFYKHLFDKLDIEMQIIRPANNKFKSAVEPYFLDKMSDANREQNTVLLNSIWDKICNDISV
ncbi:MAG: S49 family peptidase, partial [Bacteroidales bacterium]|nr:S49 family peptidase [Bacteroidales bacterium]